MTYQKSDPVEDLISQLYHWDVYEEDVRQGQVEWITATEVLLKCRGMDHPNKQQVDTAGQVLRRLTGRNPIRRGKAGTRCFCVPKLTREDGSLFGRR